MQFKTLGYFEELLDAETGICYGTRACGNIGRTQGYNGRVTKTFRKGEQIVLDKGHKKDVVVRFKKPTTCYLILHRTCGRALA